MVEKKDILKAWRILRESTEAQSIPDVTLDFIKDAALKALEKIEEFDSYLTFEEAVNTPGSYIAESFVEGVCMEVSDTFGVKWLFFEDENDRKPIRENIVVSNTLPNKKFKRIYKIEELFGWKGKEF